MRKHFSPKGQESKGIRDRTSMPGEQAGGLNSSGEHRVCPVSQTQTKAMYSKAHCREKPGTSSDSTRVKPCHRHTNFCNQVCSLGFPHMFLFSPLLAVPFSSGENVNNSPLTSHDSKQRLVWALNVYLFFSFLYDFKHFFFKERQHFYVEFDLSNQ